MIDLHTHSHISDGELSPTQLIKQASSIGLKAIALTDHDTTAGLQEAEDAAVKKGIRLIRGVEIAVQHNQKEIHILALNLQKNRMTSMENFLKDIRQKRKTRNQKMLKLMQDDNRSITWEDLRGISGNEVIGRPHFAQWLIDKGIASNIPDAFNSWIGCNQPYHVPKINSSMKQAIDVIHQTGAKAIMAHPKYFLYAEDNFAKQLALWKRLGLDGIEAFHSGASAREAQDLASMADTLGLIVTGGSDFHGNNRPDRPLGYGADGMILSEKLLDQL